MFARIPLLRVTLDEDAASHVLNGIWGRNPPIGGDGVVNIVVSGCAG